MSNPSFDLWVAIVAFLRSVAWLIGVGIAVRFTSRGIHRPVINHVLIVGFFMTSVNGFVLGLNTAHADVPVWCVYLATALSLPSVVLVVGAFILRIQDSLRIRQALENIAAAAEVLDAQTSCDRGR